MNTSFFVVWVGMSQVWRKHTWEETYNVWGIWENFTQEVTLGQATEMELKLVQVTGKLTACEGGVNSLWEGQACSETSDTARTRGSVPVRILHLLLGFSLGAASCFFTTDHILCMVGNTNNLQLPLSSTNLGLLSQFSFEKPWHRDVLGTDSDWPVLGQMPNLGAVTVARRWAHMRTWQLLLDLNGHGGEGEALRSR